MWLRCGALCAVEYWNRKDAVRCWHWYEHITHYARRNMTFCRSVIQPHADEHWKQIKTLGIMIVQTTQTYQRDCRVQSAPSSTQRTWKMSLQIWISLVFNILVICHRHTHSLTHTQTHNAIQKTASKMSQSKEEYVLLLRRMLHHKDGSSRGDDGGTFHHFCLTEFIYRQPFNASSFLFFMRFVVLPHLNGDDMGI